MKKKFFFMTFLFLGAFASTKAQVGINTTNPDPSAYLEIYGNAGGFLPPRLSTSDRDKISNPKTGLLIFNSDELTMQQNIATQGDPKWVSLGGSLNSTSSWFYMPVTPIDVSVPDSTYTVNLHNAYLKQFNAATIPSNIDKSSIPSTYAKEELEFLVLGYDKSVFSNVKITDTGILSYKAEPSNVTDSTYFNVIFKIK